MNEKRVLARLGRCGLTIQSLPDIDSLHAKAIFHRRAPAVGIGSIMQDSNQHSAQREVLEREIRDAFAGVTCEGGYSWLRARFNDSPIPGYLYGDEPPYAKVKQELDDWTKLIHDETWDPFPGVGGFLYIDHIGFRYYLPAAMCRLLHQPDAEWCPGQLLDSLDPFCLSEVNATLWTRAQLVCIARFIAWMAEEEGKRIEAMYQMLQNELLEVGGSTEHVERDENPWAEASNGQWGNYLTP